MHSLNAPDGSEAAQRRRRKRSEIAMTPDERDAFLRAQPICRVATIGPGGNPHVSPLWFVWDGVALWLNSLVRSQRWLDLGRDPRLSAIVDDGGADYFQLRGIELRGRVEIAGDGPDVQHAEQLFADKYQGGGPFVRDGRHAWLRLAPTRIASWDFAKLPAR